MWDLAEEHVDSSLFKMLPKFTIKIFTYFERQQPKLSAKPISA